MTAQCSVRGPKDNEVRITFRNSRDQLDRIAPAMEEFGSRVGLDPRVTFHMTIALDELITNIIAYGYGDGGADGKDVITLVARLDGTLLTMRIIDHARPFNPLDVPEPDLDLPPEERINIVGGMGVHMIRNLMTSVEYERAEGENILILRKRLTEELKCR